MSSDSPWPPCPVHGPTCSHADQGTPEHSAGWLEHMRAGGVGVPPTEPGAPEEDADVWLTNAGRAPRTTPPVRGALRGAAVAQRPPRKRWEDYPPAVRERAVRVLLALVGVVLLAIAIDPARLPAGSWLAAMGFGWSVLVAVHRTYRAR